MTVKKITKWKSMIQSCYYNNTENSPLPEFKKQISSRSSNRRLSLSDVSFSDLSADDLSNSLVGSKLLVFSMAELKVITHDFARCNVIGEGGFGRVYKGFVDDKVKPGLVAQPVAVKLLDLDGSQGHQEWLAEIIFLGQLRHPNLVKLIGYCWEEDYRLLIYEYMPRGSLENQLFRIYSATLPWSTRMKIAMEAAKGLAFLHQADKPVIYRDFKTSNILLDSDYTAKLSDFGLARDESLEGEETQEPTRIMGTQGYVAPEYITTGHLTIKSDVYSFGVVLLELLSGKKSIQKSRPRAREQSLVEWARPLLKDQTKLFRVIDSRLEGQFSAKGAQKAAKLARKCLSHNPKTRPSMSEVVEVLESLQDFDDLFVGPFVYVVPNESYGEENFGKGLEGETNIVEKKYDGKDDRKYNVYKVNRENRTRHWIRFMCLINYSRVNSI